MPEGVPLTPEQIATAAEAYRKHGTFAAAGAAIGHDRSVARRALLAAGVTSRHELHARACAEAERRARARIDATSRELRARVAKLIADGKSVPSDIASLVRALVDADRLIVTLNDSLSRRALNEANRRALDRATSNDGTAGELLVVELPAEGGRV